MILLPRLAPVLIPAVTLLLAAVAVLVLLVPGTVPLVDRTLVPLWARLVLALAGVRWTAEGTERVPPGPVVFVANHRSYFDIPVLWLALRRPVRFVAKRELAGIPFFGWALRLLGHVVIDRGDSAQAREAMARAVERVRRGVSVLVFAEGTRGTPELIARQVVGPFKKGGIILAIRAGVPIVPVAIAGTERILPKGSLAIRPAAVRVTVQRPVETAGLADEARDRVTREVRGAIVAAIGEGTRPAEPGSPAGTYAGMRPAKPGRAEGPSAAPEARCSEAGGQAQPGGPSAAPQAPERECAPRSGARPEGGAPPQRSVAEGSEPDPRREAGA
jgi:1-acyl-sn-glycerol-3-phosphate acyltransferase